MYAYAGDALASCGVSGDGDAYYGYGGLAFGVIWSDEGDSVT